MYQEVNTSERLPEETGIYHVFYVDGSKGSWKWDKSEIEDYMEWQRKCWMENVKSWLEPVEEDVAMKEQLNEARVQGIIARDTVREATKEMINAPVAQGLNSNIVVSKLISHHKKKPRGEAPPWL